LHECYLSFSSVDEIRDFVSLATRQTFPITLESGSLRVRATAIMSIFSMGLHTPLRIAMPKTPETATFLSAIAPYQSLSCRTA